MMNFVAGKRKNEIHRIVAAGILAILMGLPGARAGAQTLNPMGTRTQFGQLQAFVLGDATWTHFNGGRNIGTTYGVNFIYHRFFGIAPGLEARATFPVDSGTTAGLKTFVFGPNFTMHHRRYRPYADVLIGTGRLTLVYPMSTYTSDNSMVEQVGVGTDFDLRGGWAVRVEGSMQHWDIGNPGGVSSVFTPVSASFGLRYRFAALRQ
jgi:hypothetical protein